MKSETSLSSCEEEGEEETTERQDTHSTPTEVAEIPEDLDDRIDRSAVADADEPEEQYPIRGTIISAEEAVPEPPINVRPHSPSLSLLTSISISCLDPKLYNRWC
jgi:hypothetical protein